MSMLISKKQHTSAVTPYQTMRGHTNLIQGVAHLHDGQRIITCSIDGSLRMWDLQNSTQIGDDWRDEEDEEEDEEYDYEEDEIPELRSSMWAMALSPSGNTVASGSYDGTVRLWDVETPGKIVAKWIGHHKRVRSVCWRPDGERVGVGSADGIVRIWDVETGKTVLGPMETGHESVAAVIYSPDSTKFATGGYDDITIRILNAKTGEVIFTHEFEQEPRDWVFSLTWTSDKKELISGLHDGSIRIFDTATWQQIALLEGHKSVINTLSLFPNERLLVSTSWDNTVRLWNLDTNLPIGPPLQHEDAVSSASLSADGKSLVTGCHDQYAYVWDIHNILREAGLEDLLSVVFKAKGAPGKFLMDTDATRRPAVAHRLPRGFFDDTHGGIHSSTTRDTHTHTSGRRTVSPFLWSPHALLSRLSSPFRSSKHDGEATELNHRQKRTIVSRRSPPVVEVATVQDKKALFVARRPEHDKAQQQQTQRPAQASTSQTQPTTSSTSTTHPNSDNNNNTMPGTPTVKSRILSVLAHLVLFVCCASAQHANGRK